MGNWPKPPTKECHNAIMRETIETTLKLHNMSYSEEWLAHALSNAASLYDRNPYDDTVNVAFIKSAIREIA